MNVKPALQLVIDHVEKHSNNKYQNSILDSELTLKQPVFTLLTANKYLIRYLAKQGEKVGNTRDLMKAIHFILFEIQNTLPAPVEPLTGEMFEKELDKLCDKYGYEISYTTKRKG